MRPSKASCDRAVGVLAIAGLFAGVITHPAVNGRHGVVGDPLAPGRFILFILRECPPSLAIFTGRTGIIAGKQKINVIGALGTVMHRRP